MAKAQLVAGGLAPRQGLQSLQLQGLEKGLGQGPVRGQGADTRRTEDARWGSGLPVHTGV